MRKTFTHVPPVNGYPEWNNNPEIFELNRLPAHATMTPFATREAALSGAACDSSCTLSLDGTWKFSWAPVPESRVQGFEVPGYDTSAWGDIQVPGHWQLQGWDYPQYTNVQYPWVKTEELQPPFAPKVYNPVGTYVRTFTLPEGFANQRRILRFDGVDSAFYVWVNGDLVGFSQDSFTPAEFDITPYTVEGENTLAVEVYRWSDASWLEDQDFWRLSGIFRPVCLYAVPHVHVSDIFAQGIPDATLQDGELNVAVTLTATEDAVAGDYTLNFELTGEGTAAVWSRPVTLSGEQTLNLTTSTAVSAPKLWTAETPFRYTLLVTLLDGAGHVLEVQKVPVGFRRVTIENAVLKVNGQRIVFKGTNRHEFSCHSGRTVPAEEMIRDILTMKRNNINAVRTSHYPNSALWYELCDTYGLYVIDETNLETHGTWKYGDDGQMWNRENSVPGSNPRWTAAVCDRARSMVMRDRNHPSVILWSLGNESWGGENFAHMRTTILALDKSRPIHYEGVMHDRRYDWVSDVESQMYTKPHQCETYIHATPLWKRKPFILCEFTHAMGNSCGNLFKYTELWDQYPSLQGGFVWDWIDQALLKTQADGTSFLAYGGDYNEPQHDGNFSGNGLVFADGSPTPKLQEIRQLFSNIHIRSKEPRNGKVTIINRRVFTDTSDLTFTWKLLRNGEAVQSGAFDLLLAPGGEQTVSVPVVLPADNEEYALEVAAAQKEATPWSPAGYEIAFGQWVLTSALTALSLPSVSAVSAENTDAGCILSAAGVKATFSRISGLLTSLTREGTELLAAPVSPEFWRAMTDNDRGCRLHERAAVWKDAARTMTLSAFVTGTGTLTTVHSLNLPFPAVLKTQWLLDDTGHLSVSQTLTPAAGLPEIPSVGMLWQLTAGHDDFRYYGFGPEENHIDRCCGARLGVYQSAASRELVPYLKPQECGNRTGVRQLTFTSGSIPVVFTADIPVEASVLPWTPAELEAAPHQHELPKSEKTVVRLAARQMGVGGDDSWASPTHPEFLIPAGQSYSLGYTVRIK